MNHPTASVHGFEAFRANPYFKALDGLRAISILLVLAHHVSRYPPGHVLHTLQENGRYGVAFFFVISGFLICTLLLREQEDSGRVDLWRFYGRRALRLLPLYYAALLLQAILVYGLHQYSPENREIFSQKLPAYLFYYSNWLATATQGPFFCSWSLAVEEQFYLTFALVLSFAGRRVVVGAALLALVAKPLVFALCRQVDVDSTLWRVVFSYQEPILLGVLLAVALNQRETYDSLARWLRPPWVPAALGAATALWLIAHPMRTQTSWDAQWLYLLMTLSLAAIVIRPRTPGLDHPLLSHIGKVSYGIYLLHMFVVSSVKRTLGESSPALNFLLSAIAVIVVASVVYKYFEQPIITFYKRSLSPAGGRTGTPASNLAPTPTPPTQNRSTTVEDGQTIITR